MGRWYLGQLENGFMLEDVAFLDLEIQEHAGSAAAGLVIFQQPVKSAYQEIVATQRKELEEEIAGLRDEADRVAEEARELAGEVPF